MTMEKQPHVGQLSTLNKQHEILDLQQMLPLVSTRQKHIQFMACIESLPQTKECCPELRIERHLEICFSKVVHS